MVDNPQTTSTITYKSQFKTSHASSTVYIWHGSLTALEIVA